jgi:hypothetical protein
MTEENTARGVLTVHLARTFSLTWCNQLIDPFGTVYSWWVFCHVTACARCPACAAAFCRQRNLPLIPLDPDACDG